MIVLVSLKASRTAKADLYRLVFNTRSIKYVVSVMMLFFLLHPVMPAFASEVAASEDSAAAESEPAADAPSVTSEVSSTPEAVEDISLPASAEEPAVVSTDESTPAELTVPVSESEALEEQVPAIEVPTEAVSETVPEPVVIDEPVQDPVEETTVPEPEPASDDEPAAAPEEDIDDDRTGTTTVPEPEFFEIQSDVSHTDSLYQFTKSQCVSMGGGAFHCFDTSTDALMVTDDALYVDRDSDGDKEIFLRSDGDVHQITNNKLDDDAPYFDAVSNTIVWHRLENGQYAIYSYQDERESRVSDGASSSMEPHRAGQYTVWQSWLDNRWQVVLHDGTSARVISSNAAQNIAPQVEGAYVIWNVTTGTEHTVAVYEIATGLTSLIEDSEGARVMNPRFVLVYDTKFENGDVITKGYDAETGDIIPLAAAAPVVPEELPSSDQTGETRALLQNKSSSREEFKDELEAAPPTTGTTSPTVGETDVVVTASSSVPSVLPLTDFDIIVEPFSASASGTQSTQ